MYGLCMVFKSISASGHFATAIMSDVHDHVGETKA